MNVLDSVSRSLVDPQAVSVAIDWVSESSSLHQTSSRLSDAKPTEAPINERELPRSSVFIGHCVIDFISNYISLSKSL